MDELRRLTRSSSRSTPSRILQDPDEKLKLAHQVVSCNSWNLSAARSRGYKILPLREIQDTTVKATQVIGYGPPSPPATLQRPGDDHRPARPDSCSRARSRLRRTTLSSRPTRSLTICSAPSRRRSDQPEERYGVCGTLPGDVQETVGDPGRPCRFAAAHLPCGHCRYDDSGVPHKTKRGDVT